MHFPGFPRQRWPTTVGRLACSGQWACTEPGAHSPAGWCGVCMHSNFTGRCRLAMAGRQCEEEIRLLKACSLHWKSKMHVYVRAWWQGEPRQVGHSQDGTSSVQFSSVTQLCLTLCDPMDCSTPGLPVRHQLLEFTQTHVH